MPMLVDLPRIIWVGILSAKNIDSVFEIFVLNKTRIDQKKVRLKSTERQPGYKFRWPGKAMNSLMKYSVNYIVR